MGSFLGKVEEALLVDGFFSNFYLEVRKTLVGGFLWKCRNAYLGLFGTFFKWRVCRKAFLQGQSSLTRKNSNQAISRDFETPVSTISDTYPAIKL